MICENCNIQHDGHYGSGRFCSSKCAKCFSTKNKRTEINKIVSEKLKGRKACHNHGFKKGYDPRRRQFGPEDWAKSVIISKETRIKRYKESQWDDLPLPEKRRRIFKEQQGTCLLCGIKEWENKNLTLELDHIDGDHNNDSKNNLRFLCPNCHSQTPTYRRKNKKTYIKL